LSYLLRIINVIKFSFSFSFSFSFFLIILCSSSLAAPDKKLLRELDIQRELFADAYQSFNIDDQPTIYVLQENTTAITRGVAVMIADSGVPIMGLTGFAALANELNKIGWVTILIPAPDTSFLPAISPEDSITDSEVLIAETDTETEENVAVDTQVPITVEPMVMGTSKSMVATIDDQAFVDHEQQLVSLLQAAIEKSQEYPGFFLVISKGTSAAWLSKIYAEKTLDAPDALVAISPYWPDRKHNQRLPEWIANTSMPVLDLYSSWDNGWARKTVAQRQISAIKSLKLQYRQRELLGLNMHRQYNTYVGKEIYGWISYMGW
jgi:hypothetical protein